MSVWGGMVMMVLSKLRTLTVVSVTSSTIPLAPALSIVIQSPRLSMLLTASCTPATRPVSVSLNTSISTVAATPSPVSSEWGERLMMILMMMMTPMPVTMSLPSWMKLDT